MNLNNLLQASDFKSLGSDAEGTIELSIPMSFVLPAPDPAKGYSTIEFHQDLVLGTRNAPMLTSLSNSRFPGQTSPGSNLVCSIDDVDGSPSQGIVFVYRVSPTTVRLSFNFGGSFGEGAVTCTLNSPLVITAKIRTFIDPFIQ